MRFFPHLGNSFPLEMELGVCCHGNKDFSTSVSHTIYLSGLLQFWCLSVFYPLSEQGGADVQNKLTGSDLGYFSVDKDSCHCVLEICFNIMYNY